MQYCKKCVNVDTRPDTGEFIEGICPSCRLSDLLNKQKIDFDERIKELKEIVQWGRENTKSSYDCIVTVSGGKDSTRQSFFARDELNMKPLLVNMRYPPEQINERGAHNLSNLISHGFDTVSISLNPQVWKKLVRRGFFKFGNWMKSSELALYSVPIHVAIAYKVPLIFLGENPLYTIGQQEGNTEGGDATGMKYSNTLQGGKPDDKLIEGLSQNQLYFYYYPSDDEIEYAKLRIVYLGYYIKGWSGLNNAKFAISKGLKIRDDTPENMGNYTGISALDEDFWIVNQMIKYIKFGFGAVTDEVCEAIKNGIMSREKGIELVKNYDGKCGDIYIDRFCKFLNITKEQFWETVESYRGEEAWKKDGSGRWRLKAELE